MEQGELISAGLMLGGMVVTALAIGSTIQVLRTPGQQRSRELWRMMLSLQIGFFGVHLLVGVLALTRPAEVLPLLVGASFCVGSLFALLSTRLSTATLAERRDDQEAAEALCRERSALLSNMSHELRTPLTAIIGYSDLLLEELADDRTGARRDLLRISQAGARLLGTIDNLLDHARLEAGRVELAPAPVDLRALLDELVAHVQPLAEQSGNRLTISVAPDLPELVADPARLHQILLNLLANACKFTSDGDITLEIDHTAGRLLFTVSDTGIGMSAEQLALIFRPFVQATGHAVRRDGGIGLGLTIARQLARLMGGDIAAASTPGRGSRFTLHLPARPAHDAGIVAAPAGQRGEHSMAGDRA